MSVPATDPLASPWARREVWRSIAVTLTEYGEAAADRAREAIGYACMAEPPRDWPQGTEAVLAGLPERVARESGWYDPLQLDTLGPLHARTWPA